MTIAIVCSSCLGEFRVKDELAGKRVRCKSCAEPIKVPGGERERPVTRVRKPVLDELDDWDEPEQELPPIRSKASSKKKRRRQSPSIDIGAWAAKLATFNIGPILLQVATAVLVLLFVAGFWYPSAAALCVTGILLASVLLYVGSIIAVFVIAAREHVMCFLLCFIPLYFFWFVISRFDRTALAVTLFLCGGFGGWAVSAGVVQAYRTANVHLNEADLFGAVNPHVRPQAAAMRQPLVATGDASALFPVSSIPVPTFTMESVPSPDAASGIVYQVRCSSSDGSVGGAAMSLRLRLPAGQHPAQSLPCILIAPAGSTLITGMDLDPINHTAETAPYVQAGYAVVEYSVDGAMLSQNSQPTTGAYVAFANAQAGVVNGRNALQFVLSNVPQVNPQRIYAAGHSSAAVLALLLAEHEPRIGGCIAYAPATDVEARLRPNLAQIPAESLFPGVYNFLKRSSPKTHASQLKCPVFLFHAQDDSNEPIATTRAFHALLQSLGKQSTFIEVPTGDHYESMIRDGIPAGLRWLQQLPGNS